MADEGASRSEKQLDTACLRERSLGQGTGNVNSPVRELGTEQGTPAPTQKLTRLIDLPECRVVDSTSCCPLLQKAEISEARQRVGCPWRTHRGGILTAARGSGQSGSGSLAGLPVTGPSAIGSKTSVKSVRSNIENAEGRLDSEVPSGSRSCGSPILYCVSFSVFYTLNSWFKSAGALLVSPETSSSTSHSSFSNETVRARSR